MKLCFITSLYPPLAFGGATGVAQIEAEHLIKRGHEVFVITTSPDKDYHIEEIAGVKIYRLPSYNLYSFYENFKNQNAHNLIFKILWHIIDTFNFKIRDKIKRIIVKENPHIVHVHNFAGLSTLIFNQIKKENIPLVFTAHDYHILCPRANLLKSNHNICENRPLPCSIYFKTKKMLLDNKPDIVLAPSNFILKKFKNEGIFENSKLVRLSNPIPLINSRPASKDYETLKILYVGELSKHKGIHILLKAFERIDNAKLHIYGKGPYEDNLRKKERENVIFHGYAKGFQELIEAYKRANITVVPSWYDNSPMVVYESFACSTPVVASRIGGIPELVRDGYNGFLFEPGSTRELSRILRRIADNPETLKELEDNAFNSVKKYDIKKHIDKLERIYKSITK